MLDKRMPGLANQPAHTGLDVGGQRQDGEQGFRLLVHQHLKTRRAQLAGLGAVGSG